MPKLNAIIYRDESGVYCAEIPALPGCFSDGDTIEEAVANIREAAEGWLLSQANDVGKALRCRWTR